VERIRLFSIIAASGAGGAEQVFATLLQGLDPERFEVIVACHGRGSMVETYSRHASQVWNLDLVDLRKPSTITRLAGLMRESQCDVVHTHLWTADVLGGLAARLAGVRRVVSSVAGAYFLPIGVSGWRRTRRQAFSRLFRATYRRCDRVIAPSHYVAHDLLTRPGIRVPKDRLCVIENGVDVDHEERLVRYADGGGSSAEWGTGSPRICVVANFFPIKGHEFLIRAVPAVLAAHPQTRFVLAGDGEIRTAMIGLADQLGVGGNVTFPGEIADSLELMRASDLVVIPSISEGLPISLVEAMALGRCVVTTGVGGIPEVVEDGVSARVVPARDPEALAAAMLELLGDNALARQLGARAQLVAAERFSADRMVRRTQELYVGLHEA
jgi:glycosyltransferase involved in cell wall biosynthesis